MTDLLTALALVLVLEGLGPALMPGHWRNAMRTASEWPDAVLRRVGVTAMLAGLLLLQWVRG